MTTHVADDTFVFSKMTCRYVAPRKTVQREILDFLSSELQLVGPQQPRAPGWLQLLGSSMSISGGSRRSCWRAKGVWDAVDTSPDLGGQNVLKTIEMAIRHNRRPTRRELEFSVAGFILIYVRKYFSDPLTGGDRPHRGSATDEYCIGVRVNKIEKKLKICAIWQISNTAFEWKWYFRASFFANYCRTASWMRWENLESKSIF